MNSGSSRRAFVAMAAGGIAWFVSGLSRALARPLRERPDAQPDEPICDKLPEVSNATRYTYDHRSRLIAVTGRSHAVTTTFAYNDT